MQRITLPNGRAYDVAGKGKQSLFSTEHCCVCGRPAKGDNWLLLFRAEDGSREFAIGSTVGLTVDERRSVWIAPIGPECLRKHPELAFALIATPADTEQLVRLCAIAQQAIEVIPRLTNQLDRIDNQALGAQNTEHTRMETSNERA